MHVLHSIRNICDTANLYQPSVIKLFNEDAERLTLWLEFIPGRALSDYVDEGSISLFEDAAKYQIWVDISNALEYLRAQNVLHHDIKPDNIIFTEEENRAVLCDFGISSLNIPGKQIHPGGTPCYVPPEYLGFMERSFPSDIWAFGVTLLFVYQFISLPRGRWRIRDIHNSEESVFAPPQMEMKRWLDHLAKVQEGIPSNLSLLQKMLHSDPENRITAPQLVKWLESSQKLDKTERQPLSLELCTS